MLAVASLLVVVLVSLLITRVATVALTLTGMSRESARFQARSALSGVGFTTSEAEAVVHHPVRRRVVMLLMLAGSAGIVTVVGTLVLSFGNAEPAQREARIAVLVGALFVLFLLARSETVDRRLSRLIARGLDRWTELDARDYAALLHVGGDYAVVEHAVQEGHWLAGATARVLRERGIVLLGVTHADGTYEGAPGLDLQVAAGETLVLYGSSEKVCAL